MSGTKARLKPRLFAGVDRFAHERALLAKGVHRIAGVDEAGRGPLAGPVVVAAAVFAASTIRAGLPAEWEGLNDSKQLTETARERFYGWIMAGEAVQVAVEMMDVATIDRMNILRATHEAMRKALRTLDPAPETVLVDGLEVEALGWPQVALVGGDARSYSIAAASVVAKVTRDRLMLDLDAQYPGYGFARHKGYGTPEHLAALARLGPCPIHRRSFAPVRGQQLELL